MLSKVFSKTLLTARAARLVRTVPRLLVSPRVHFFSTEVEVGEPEPVLTSTEKKEFKAETRKLLDIVAKSIYTDKEVFLRELMSNCSDALEKQRYAEISGASTAGASEGLFINIATNEKERTLTIFDSGVGMTREEITENLGTIAKSGSQEFMRSMRDSQQPVDSIIGQFGVGFYSTFIVADSVEVFSQAAGAEGVRWASDGSGQYEVSTVANLDFPRGTKIVLKLKAESREFAREQEVEKILKKYSLFITYPIKVNGQLVNNLQAVWYRDKRDVTEDEYERFFEHLANTKVPYKFKLHYSTDVPLTIKALFYVPSTHAEQMGIAQEQAALHLYCRKVMIKERCQELLPPYLRFVKGVVDCEDLPLNISRETYQDSSLIAKLRNVVTRRVLKMLEDELKRDPARYDQWYGQFQHFLKEGLMMDAENKETLFKLMRYTATFTEKPEAFVGLEDYVKRMKPGQQRIYYVIAPTREAALASPFMQPFKAAADAPPVLVLTQSVDEVLFNQTGSFKSFQFASVETSYEDVAKDLGAAPAQDEAGGLPEEDVATFSLWLKGELSVGVSKVQISKRLREEPAVIFGQMSASMRAFMMMMEQQGMGQPGQDQALRNNTLEINPRHAVILKLNALRKKDPKQAGKLARSLYENVLLSQGIPFDIVQSSRHNLDTLNDFLHLATKGHALH